jgi:hypothetical protein
MELWFVNYLMITLFIVKYLIDFDTFVLYIFLL